MTSLRDRNVDLQDADIAPADTAMSMPQIRQILQQASDRMKAKLAAASDDSHIRLQSTDILGRKEQQAWRPQTHLDNLPAPYISTANGVATLDSRRSFPDVKNEGTKNQSARLVKDPILLKQEKQMKKDASTGPLWFNMPRTDLTPELKRDLQLLNMRGTLDPKRFYKKESSRAKPPPFSQVGTIIAGPTEYGSRLTNKEQKRTLAEEILAKEDTDKRFKKKYNEIQAAKTSGKKAHLKRMQEKRSRHAK